MKIKSAIFIGTLICTLCLKNATCQEIKFDTIKESTLQDTTNIGDTSSYIKIKTLEVFGKWKHYNKRYWDKYYIMVFNLPRVYKYAKIAKAKLAEMDEHFIEIKTKKEKKKYIKQIETEMLAQYKSSIKSLTRSQGKMLIKLFNRETGNTAYAFIKEMKGGFSAFFWQSIAFFFGANLKSTFGNNEDDIILENLIDIYEKGDYNLLYKSVFGMGMDEHDKYLKNKKKNKRNIIKSALRNKNKR